MRTILLTTAISMLIASTCYGQIRAAQVGSAEAAARILEYEYGKGRAPTKPKTAAKPDPKRKRSTPSPSTDILNNDVARKRLVDARRRTWTSANGKFKVDAMFISMGAGISVLERNDKTRIQVPLEQLSKEDQDFIQNRDWLKVETLLRQFAGRWQITDDNGVTASFFSLTGDLRASKSHAPDVTAQWDIVGDEVRITWSDGWRDIVRRQGSGYVKVAFKPGTSWDDSPANTQHAIREPAK